LEWIIPGNK